MEPVRNFGQQPTSQQRGVVVDAKGKEELSDVTRARASPTRGDNAIDDEMAMLIQRCERHGRLFFLVCLFVV